MKGNLPGFNSPLAKTIARSLAQMHMPVMLLQTDWQSKRIGKRQSFSQLLTQGTDSPIALQYLAQKLHCPPQRIMLANRMTRREYQNKQKQRTRLAHKQKLFQPSLVVCTEPSLPQHIQALAPNLWKRPVRWNHHARKLTQINHIQQLCQEWFHQQGGKIQQYRMTGFIFYPEPGKQIRLTVEGKLQVEQAQSELSPA